MERGDYQNLSVGLALHFLDLFVVKGDNLPAVQHSYQNTMIIIPYDRQAVDVFDRKLLKYGVQVFRRGGADKIKSGNIPHYDKVIDTP